MKTLFKGALLHNISKTKLEIIPNAVVGVSAEGVIEFVKRQNAEKIDETNYKVVTLKKTQFLIPGFVDTHTHAPQYANCGLGLDLPLLPWLNKYTFPAESKFKDVEFAKKIYEKCVRRHLKNGTTTAVYFATIYTDSSVLLAKLCKQYGQRAYVGKINMDRNGPEYYVEKDAQTSLAETERFIKEVQALNDDLIHPIITPRFVGTCTNELLTGLGELAEKHDLCIQSHVSENIDELKWVDSLHPGVSYTEVYDKFKLMTKKTIMAHGVWLTEKELDIFNKRGSSVSHCPLSNFYLRSGALNVRRVWDKEVNVCLGTDVSGGAVPAMFNAIRNAIINSTFVHIQHRDDVKHMEDYIQSFYDPKHETTPAGTPSTLSMEEALYTATLGGAQSIGLENRIGNFVAGKEFDALIIDLDTDDTAIDSFEGAYVPVGVGAKENMTPEEELEVECNRFHHYLQRFVHCGDDRNIVGVFVKGRNVSEKLKEVTSQ